MEFELKKCPSCRGEAELKTGVKATNNALVPMKGFAMVKCKECGMQTEKFEDRNLDGVHILEAINSWNKRPAEERLELSFPEEAKTPPAEKPDPKVQKNWKEQWINRFTTGSEI